MDIVELISRPWVILILAVLLMVVLPVLLGRLLSSLVRMPDYWWKIAVILGVLGFATTIFLPREGRPWPPLKLGVDLAGGTILIYEIDENAGVAAREPVVVDEGGTESAVVGTDRSVDMSALIEALIRRINPTGTKEIVIRPYGDRQVEIIIPETDDVAIQQIKRQITSSGFLEFMIVANSRDHLDIVEMARASAENPQTRRSRSVVDEQSNRPIGYWARLARDEDENLEVAGVRPFKVTLNDWTLRNARTGEIIPQDQQFFSDVELLNELGRQLRADRINVAAATQQLLSAGMLTEKDEPQRQQLVRSLPLYEQAMREFESENPRGPTLSPLAVWAAFNNVPAVDVLMVVPPRELRLTGEHLAYVSQDVDENLSPNVSFTMTSQGAQLMAILTGNNLPQPGYYRHLGIVMDQSLLSAPRIISTISDRGQISGRFTEEEVASLVNILRAGRLPAVLKENPISENKIGAVLGHDTIVRGSFAIGVSLTAVVLFMLLYYRFSGVVACLGLAINIALIMALMSWIGAALTLPGLAGLVLTVGMSVDANVLIFERIREELSRGTALRMAIRNGFDRATTTIVDANVTTLITGVVLYAIGTDQVRGFAVTLILGILMSMFTAIFVSRVILDIAERNRWISTLRMMRLLGITHIDFMGKRRIAIAASTILILVGLAGVVARGKQILDIDFLGGTSVHVQFTESIPNEQVRRMLNERLGDAYDAVLQDETYLREQVFSDLTPQQLQETVAELQRVRADDFTLNRLDVTNLPPNTVYKIDSPIPEVALLERALARVFERDGRSLLATYNIQVGAPQQVVEESPDVPPVQGRAGEMPSTQPPLGPARAQEPATSGSANPPQTGAGALEQTTPPAETNATPESNEGAAAELPDESWLALAGEGELLLAQAETAQPADSQPAESQPADEQPAETPAGAANQQPDTAGNQSPAPENQSPAANSQVLTLTSVTLNFGTSSIDAQTLQQEIEYVANELNVPVSVLELQNPNWDGEGNASFGQWTVRMSTSVEQTQQILSQLEERLESRPVWPSSSEIGSRVADDTSNLALAAIAASLIGIVIYIWIRFQRVAFGLAAVVALIHDVLVTLGAIALSYWLADLLGFLLIEEFRISLTVVAAFLTIIGYSLNDTIVIFDRIREVRGKSPALTGEMINTSINQTLSRTLLTSLTTLIVVVILYAMGGQGIHAFAFSLVIGVVAGTYSTVYIAAPILLWLVKGNRDTTEKSATY